MPVYVEDDFFALKLSPNKTYSQEVEMPFRVAMAALDTSNDSELVDGKRVRLMVRIDEDEIILCNLIVGKIEQQTLSHVFTPGENVTFFLAGTSTAESGLGVHLTGNFLSFENEFDEGYGETLGTMDTTDDEEDDEDIEFDSEMDDFIVSDDSDAEAVDGAKEGKKSPKIKEITADADSSTEEDDDVDSDASVEDLDSEDMSVGSHDDTFEGQSSEDDSEVDSDDDSSAPEISDADSEEVDSESADDSEEDSEEEESSSEEEVVAPVRGKPQPPKQAGKPQPKPHVPFNKNQGKRHPGNFSKNNQQKRRKF